ncbi:hypothetical protein Trydic_g1834 [Trypoxylus dichotomus]
MWSNGIQIDTSSTCTSLFVDDRVAEDQQDMTYMLNKLVEEYQKWGLEVNKDKTQYMVVGGEEQDIQLPNGRIKFISYCKYLGVTITADKINDKDLMQKVSRGENVIKMPRSILWTRDLTNGTKRHVFKTMVKPVMMRGSEV